MSLVNKQDVGQLFRFILGRCSLCLSGAICRRPAIEAAVCVQVVLVKSRPWTKRATPCWLPLCEEERNGALSGLLLIVRRQESSRLQPRCRALHGGSLRAQDGPDGPGITLLKHADSPEIHQPLYIHRYRPTGVMELYASGFNAWGQLFFNRQPVDSAEADLHEFACVLESSTIEHARAFLSHTTGRSSRVQVDKTLRTYAGAYAGSKQPSEM